MHCTIAIRYLYSTRIANREYNGRLRESRTGISLTKHDLREIGQNHYSSDPSRAVSLSDHYKLSGTGYVGPDSLFLHQYGAVLQPERRFKTEGKVKAEKVS